MKTSHDRSKVDSNPESCSGQDALRKGKKPKTKSIEQAKSMGPEDEAAEVLNKIDLKSQLTITEMKFLELKFVEGLSTDKAMILSGYDVYSQNHRYFLAKKIIEKYESSGGDHRKIFRSIGAGETAVAEGLLKLATTAKSEMVRLNAWTVIAKCLGLQKEVVDVQTGISIIIQRHQTPSEEPDGGYKRPDLALADKKALSGPAPIEILK